MSHFTQGMGLLFGCAVQRRLWLFCTLLLPLVLSLGFWQLERAQQKREQQANFDQQASEAVTGISALSAEQIRPLRTYVISGYLKPPVYLLDNRTREGRAGYEVLQRFDSDSGLSLLLNRGWLPAPHYREQLPDISWPSEHLSLQGYWYQARHSTPLLNQQAKRLNANGFIAPEPKLEIQRIQAVAWQELAQLEQLVQGEFRPNSELEGLTYRLGWPLYQMSPEKHQAYALQWFALAMTLVVLTFWASIKLRRRN